MDILFNRLINHLVMTISSHTSVNDGDIEKIRYSLIVILGELFKFVILSILFTILGRFSLFLFSLALLLILRSFSGGKHFGGTLQCLLVSMLFFIVTCIVAVDIFPVTKTESCMFLISSLVLVALFAPCPNPKRPIKHKKRKRNLWILSVLSSSILGLLLFFLSDSNLLACGSTTLLLQSVQLIHWKGGVSNEM